ESVVEVRVDAGVEDGVITERSDTARLVDNPHSDRISPDSAGVDEVIRSLSHAIETGDDVGKRLDAGGVLHLDQAEDVGVDLGQSREDLDSLPVELRLCVWPPTILILGRAT